ncbi:MAG TPA: hypothetical protein VFZ62_02400 [Candidatus Saccharimonadales bacterium]
MATQRPDSSTDPTQPIPRDETGCTPPPSPAHTTVNFGTRDGDAHLRPTSTGDGPVTSGEPQPRQDGRR